MVSSSPSGNKPVGWPSRLTRARLHFVTGKGGTGKSTIAAALALCLAAGGRKVLLVEVEGRQGIAQLFDVPPLPYEEVKIATAEGGGVVNALAIDTEAAFLEYLDMFYNLGLAGRAMRRIGAVEFATTIAPGLRDVILTGKKSEAAKPEKPKKEKPKKEKGKKDKGKTGQTVEAEQPVVQEVQAPASSEVATPPSLIGSSEVVTSSAPQKGKRISLDELAQLERQSSRPSTPSSPAAAAPTNLEDDLNQLRQSFEQDTPQQKKKGGLFGRKK